MEGRQHWRKKLAAAFGCAALIFGYAESSQAEMFHSSLPNGTHAEFQDFAGVDGAYRWLSSKQSAPTQMECLSLQERYEQLQRTLLESLMTAILIKWGNPPPIGPAGQGNEVTPPPPGEGENPPPPPPPPPPPDGNGENPPIDPPIDPPPPQQTPEPSSLVIAGLGTALTSFYSWRRRRQQSAAAS
jgi:hypothetical protein